MSDPYEAELNFTRQMYSASPKPNNTSYPLVCFSTFTHNVKCRHDQMGRGSGHCIF